MMRDIWAILLATGMALSSCGGSSNGDRSETPVSPAGLPDEISLSGTKSKPDSLIDENENLGSVNSTPSVLYENNGVYAIKGSAISTPAGALVPYGLYVDEMAVLLAQDHKGDTLYEYSGFDGAIPQLAQNTIRAESDLEFRGVYNELNFSDQSNRYGDAVVLVSADGFMRVDGPEALKDVTLVWEDSRGYYNHMADDDEKLEVSGYITGDLKYSGVSYYTDEWIGAAVGKR